MNYRILLLGVVLVSFAGLTNARSQEPVVQEATEQAARISYEPLRRDQIDSLFDSLRAGSTFAMPPTRQSQQVDPNIAGIWAGTSTKIESELGEIVLRFRPTIEARLAQSEKSDSPTLLADQADVRIRMMPKGMSIVHELAQNNLDRAGILAEIQIDRAFPTRTAYIPGYRDSGFYFSVPSMIRADAEKTWGMMICPRIAKLAQSKRGAPLQLELLASPYELSEVKLSFAASGSLRIPGSSYKQRLAVNLGLTAELPASIESKDEVVAQAPSLRMLYRPVTPFDFFRFAPKSSIQEGVLTKVEMQNQAGYLRTQYFGNVVYVHKLVEPSPISVVFKGRRAMKDEGTCYVLVSDKPMWTEYDKKTPEL